MKLARDTLRAKGYDTLEAVDGEDGVRLALQHRPDLVLMDIAFLSKPINLEDFVETVRCMLEPPAP